jgi:hypothetical protein
MFFIKAVLGTGLEYLKLVQCVESLYLIKINDKVLTDIDKIEYVHITIIFNINIKIMYSFLVL